MGVQQTPQRPALAHDEVRRVLPWWWTVGNPCDAGRRPVSRWVLVKVLHRRDQRWTVWSLPEDLAGEVWERLRGRRDLHVVVQRH